MMDAPFPMCRCFVSTLQHGRANLSAMTYLPVARRSGQVPQSGPMESFTAPRFERERFVQGLYGQRIPPWLTNATTPGACHRSGEFDDEVDR